MNLLPASTESLSVRCTVCAGTLLLHALLAWYLLHAAGQGIAGAGDTKQGNGDALVVEFVAVPAEGVARAEVPALPASNPSVALNPAINSEQAIPNAGSGRPRILSEHGEYAAPEEASATSTLPQSQATTANLNTAKRGSLTNDLIANYHAALRARIALTWRTLTDRAFPSGCDLRLNQSPGGTVTATSANRCELSQEDRLQLEAAALMAQPLPYAGYESVFATELVLNL